MPGYIIYHIRYTGVEFDWFCVSIFKKRRWNTENDTNFLISFKKEKLSVAILVLSTYPSTLFCG
jgi:hypothetical protein